VKVLISGAFWHGSLEESYARAFEAIGWKVIRFDWEQISRAHPLAKMAFADKLLRLSIADRTGKWFTAAIEDSQPDLVFVIKGRRVSPETLIQAKKILGDRPLVNFNPDSPWDAANKTKRIIENIPVYDAHFTWNRALIDCLSGAGAKSIHYLPFAYDPLLHHPLEAGMNEIIYDAVFVGTYSEERDKLLGTLASCNIRIVGNGWQRSKHVRREWVLPKALYGEDAVRVMALGACSINILRPQNIGSHNMRTFEIPASARAMLTTRSAEQSEFFAEGKEMECFDGRDELLEKILFFRDNKHHQAIIAENGYQRVRGETYEKRARTMLELLGLPA
jgi:spore maturation protein CgeB